MTTNSNITEAHHEAALICVREIIATVANQLGTDNATALEAIRANIDSPFVQTHLNLSADFIQALLG